MATVVLVGPEVEENLSLRYLAAALGEQGFASEIVPFNAPSDLTTVLERVLAIQPLVVGLSLSFQWRAQDVLALAMGLRDRGYRGHITGVGISPHSRGRSCCATSTSWTRSAFTRRRSPHRAGEYVDAYLEAAGITHERDSALFRSSLARTGSLTANGLTEDAALRIVKRRAAAAGLPQEICCHTFRATGITSFLLNGGELAKAQRIANHESSRTTELYNRTQDEITLDEIERIRI